MEKNELDMSGEAASWVSWAMSLGAPFELARFSQKDLDLLGRFTQAAMERPEDFERALRPALGAGKVNPMTPEGAGVLESLVRNGVGDDWELFLQWRPQGYVVVHEGDQTEADQRMRESQALRLMDLITGGVRRAPGLADEAAWIQRSFEAPWRKPMKASR